MLSPHPIMSEVYLYPQFWSKWTVTSKNLGTPFSKLETEILRESRPKHHIVGYNFKFELNLRIDLNYELWGQLAKPHTPPTFRVFLGPTSTNSKNSFKFSLTKNCQNMFGRNFNPGPRPIDLWGVGWPKIFRNKRKGLQTLLFFAWGTPRDQQFREPT